MEASLKT